MLTPEIVNFANYLADISQPIAQKYFRTFNGEVAKEDDSPVTKADREIEAAIRLEIEKKFPQHGIIGEEYGEQNVEADFVWILDPIDGTSSFIIGRPIFGTLIALAHKGKPILGIMNQPFCKERWIGIAGQNATFNGKKIKTRNCTELSQAVMCSGSPFFFQNDDEKILKTISGLTKYQKFGGVIYGGDCYSYTSLASGFVDIVIDPDLKVYDYAALVPIIEAAGGTVCDWKGNDLGLKSGVKILACANKELQHKVLKVLEPLI
jgi:inositol-phosphate phosphatase/L-galactose 1-phosphate phosphatase/histidinol-phosphatase